MRHYANRIISAAPSQSPPTALGLWLRFCRPVAAGGVARFRDDRIVDLLVCAGPMYTAVHEAPSLVAIPTMMPTIVPTSCAQDSGRH
jgi:hypothetical protein